MTSVAAHCLVSITNSWVFETQRFDQQPSTAATVIDARLVRVWTRVIDGGYLLDHIANELSESVDRSDEAPHETRERFARATSRLLDDADVSSDLTPAPFIGRPMRVLTPWQYVWRFLAHLVVHIIPTLLRVLYQHTKRRLEVWTDELGEWLARLLRRPTESATDDERLDDEPALSPLEAAKSEARRTLDELTGPYDVTKPPSAVPNLWRAVVRHTLGAIDERDLGVDEACDLRTDVPLRSPLAELRARYTSERDLLRRKLDHLIAAGAAPSSVESSATRPGVVRRVLRFLRRRWIRLLCAVVLVATGVALVVVNPLFGTLVVVVGLLILTAGGWFWRIGRETMTELRDGFASKHQLDDSESRAERILHLTAELTRFSYRVEQVGKWAAAIGAVARSIGQGAMLSDQQQGPFAPGNAPRALEFATGMVDELDLERLSFRVRVDADPPLFRNLWDLVQRDYPGVYDDVTRDTLRGELAVVGRLDVTGLSEETRAAERALIWRIVQDDPLWGLSGVVPWKRARSTKGLETLIPGRESPLGPVKRGGVLDPDELERARAAFGLAAVHLNGADGRLGGLGVSLPGPLLFTAAACVLAGAGVDVGLTWRIDGELALCQPTQGATRPTVALGGTGIVQIGRRAIVGTSTPMGVAPTVATITRVAANGDFELDCLALAGSPVLDVETCAVIGVATGAKGAVIGPMELRLAMLDETAEVVPDGELDPGVRAPLDVLVAAGPPPPTEDHQPPPTAMSGQDEWLEAITRGLQPAFSPYLFRDGRYDDVDDTTITSIAAAHAVTGRLLMASCAVQRSIPIPIDVFSASASADREPGNDGDPRSRGVRLDG
jgi:hypothetical protein